MDAIIDSLEIIIIKNTTFTNQELDGIMSIQNEVVPKEHGGKEKWT